MVYGSAVPAAMSRRGSPSHSGRGTSMIHIRRPDPGTVLPCLLERILALAIIDSLFRAPHPDELQTQMKTTAVSIDEAFCAANPRSRALFERGRGFMAGAAKGAYDHKPFPLTMERAPDKA